MAHLAMTGDFPMPSRSDLMSLATISGKQDQVKTTTGRFTTVRNASNNLNTNDIDGAAPKLHGSKQPKKQQLTNQNWDIDRSGPRALHMGLQKAETNLHTGDIYGAAPQIVKFQSKRQGNDPLNPNYNIPQVQVRPATPPKFIRDAMAIDDIDKSKPRPDAMAGRPTRDTMKIDDIAGTKANMRHKPRQNAGGYTGYDYSDVTKMERKSKRCSNPLDPTYTVSGDDGKAWEIGNVDGSKPAKMPDPPKDRSAFGGSLNTKDIAGAQTSTKGLGVFASVQRRADQMQSNSLDTKTVMGAQSGTLLKGPKTKRVGNPLDGNYQIPGWSELTDANNPYSVTKKEDAFAKKTVSTLQKTGEQAMGMAPSQTAGPLGNVPEHKQKALMESYANFYGVADETNVNKLSYNKLHQASRATANVDPMKGVPAHLQKDAQFKNAQKRFFQGDVSETSSQYGRATAAFFDNGGQKMSDPAAAMGNKFTSIQNNIVPANMEGERFKNDTSKFFVGDDAEIRSTGSVFQANKNAFFGQEAQTGFKIQSKPSAMQTSVQANTKGGMYRKDAAAFYGDEKFEVESQGTQFQMNAAAFLGTDAPTSGQRPVKIDKNAPKDAPKGPSYLNEARLKEHETNMQRDPNFKKNMKRFHGLPSQITRSNGPVSTANRLDAFISK